MNTLRFDNRVAIVTGAGNGLGRAHALLLASRGCKVLVNDLGGNAHGEGSSGSAADKVVAEIASAGGVAVANTDSVLDGQRIADAAMAAFGRIDILINNAGILRDASFHKMTETDWDLVYDVHVRGAFRLTRAVWNIMRDAGFGRILMTASAAGIYGNFGQANYAMAKLGLVGLSNTLAVEGLKRNVHCNVIAPLAGSRLTETILPKDLVDALRPDYVAPLAAYLVHEDCKDTGALFEVGGGFFAKLRWQRSKGWTRKLGLGISPEQVRDAQDQISSFADPTYPANVTAAMQPIMENIGSQSRGGNALIDVDAALGYQFPVAETSYNERDVSLYALGIGAGRSKEKPDELRYVYEMHPAFCVFPTFLIAPALRQLVRFHVEGTRAPGLQYGLERILHGEQRTEVFGKIPASGKLTQRVSILDIVDKGKHALVVTEIRCEDEHGNLLARHEVSAMVLGAGGFDGDAAAPRRDASVRQDAPSSKPDFQVEERVDPSQALLYRLSGDINPLHADPAFAKNFGFDAPILHGLCTFGYAARHVLAELGANPENLANIQARFAESVFPGETLVTEGWRQANGSLQFQCRVKERDKVVLSQGFMSFHTDEQRLALERAREAKNTKHAGASNVSSSSENASAKTEDKGGVTSGQIFEAIGAYLAGNPDLIKQVATVYQWNLKGPDSAWIMNLKDAPASVTRGRAEAECTLEIADSDFLDLTQGKADAQKLFFSGKLKVTGNVLASQKLSFLQKLDRSAFETAVKRAPSDTVEAPQATPVAARAPFAGRAEVLLKERLQTSLSLPKSEVLVLQVAEPACTLTIDLAERSIVQGAQDKLGAATLTLTDVALEELLSKGNLARMYQTGAVRIDGDVKFARACEALFDRVGA
jgi:(3R)-3-hydroxyacyl-CoA dehydrogenase / 3a,7a,12a-trihydroxy-5b-cholest-24-enoyl-CoA hydratase / enoyl-CoA hydratase 2